MRSCILFMFLTDPIFGWEKFLSPEQVKRAKIHPWIGVLKVGSGNKEFATGLILIEKSVAAANANDISKLDVNTLRTATKAIFFKHNMPSYCDVKDYEIHPEFDNSTLLNTLALVYLDCDNTNWTHINRLHDNGIPKTVYAIGLTDRNYDFEQIMFKMMPVTSSSCFNFYIREEINFKHLWPKHFICYKAVDVKRRCVFDSGMALVSKYNNNWTLIGISILGPGCVLPSRYINVVPYTPWLYETIKHPSYRRLFRVDGDGGTDNDTTTTTGRTAIDPSQDIVNDVSFTDDDFYLQKLNDSTMVLRPKYKNVNEIPYGDCTKDGATMIYRDSGIIRTSNRPATGVYALSLYDLFYGNVTCVMVSVRCDRRSIAKFWFDTGFKTDDMSDLIKVIPQYKRGQKVPPKILYITDSYAKYDRIPTWNLVFKFEFTAQATINVDFYGTLITKKTYFLQPPTTTTPRTRATYPHHIQTTPTSRRINIIKKYN